MRLKPKSKSQRIKEAVIKDGIDYVIGLPGIPVPKEIIKEIFKIKRGGSPANFVDWQLENWPHLYRHELDLAVHLSFKDKDSLLPQVLIFNNIEQKLNLSQIIFKLKKESFKLDDAVRALTESAFEQLLKFLRKKGRFKNEQNLRLVNIKEKKDRVEIEVQPVEYQDYVHTNLVLDAESEGKLTLREHLHSEGKLEELKDSPLANNLGVNILLFTSDGSLVLQVRSGRVAFRAGELCPSASGTISLIDVPTRITLERMLKLREAFEEVGIRRDDVPEDQIFFLGITRELIRGGNPEMFFLARTSLSEKEIRERWEDARDQWESKNLIFFHFGKAASADLTEKRKVHGFLCKVDDFLDKYIEKSSIPLLTNLALWVRYRLEQNEVI